MSTSRVFTVQQVLPSATMNDLPQGVLGITRVTANVGPTVGTTEMDVITAPAVTIAGTTRRLRISFHCRGIEGTIGTDYYALRIKEGATGLAEIQHQVINPNSSEALAAELFAIIDSPTAASHTYKVTLQRVVGTGVATVDAGAAPQAMLIIVEDVGQV